MRTVLLSFVAGLVMVSAASTVEAGTKNNSTIKVTNNTTGQIAVIANPTQAIKNLLASNNFGQAQLNQFTAAGGKLVSAGGNVDLKVKAGSNVVGAAALVQGGLGGGTTIGSSTSLTVTTTKDHTTNVSADDPSGVGTGLTLTKSP